MSTSASDDVRLGVWRAFLRSHSALMVRLEAELQEQHRLSLPAYEVLLRLAEAPGGRLRMQDLVSTALMTKSGVSRLVDRMEDGGLLTRQSCPSDRRGAYAVLSPAGRDRLRTAAPAHLRGVREHFTGLFSDAEAVAMEAVLARVLAALPWDGPQPRSCDGTAVSPDHARGAHPDQGAGAAAAPARS